ncbi:MAG: glycosyl transferase group 1 [Parcubacteria group bacterium]|nr:glycosyl transferase group 1 [Parcubacteria group bacterium]
MRVAFFSDNFYPEISGISDQLIILARNLAERGHQIDIYAPRYSGKDYKKAGGIEKELDLGEHIAIHRLFSLHVPFSPTGQSRIVLPIFLRWIFMRKRRPDVIHTHSFFGVGIEAIAAAKILRIPIVGTNHTRITFFVPRIWPIETYIDIASRRSVSMYYNRCDFVSAPALFLLTEMKNSGLRAPCEVVSNPIDTSLFKPSKNRSDLRMKLGFDQKTLLYAGRLASEKNIDTLIRAVALLSRQHHDVVLMLAGSGPQIKELTRLSEKLGVADRVRFLGNLDKPVLAEYYQVSDIFVTASTSEVQSLSLMQAIACGLPSVSVHVDEPPSYLHNEENAFLLDSNDYELLSEKISLLVTNDVIYQKMSIKCLETADRFSPENIAIQWERTYRSLIEQHDARS